MNRVCVIAEIGSCHGGRVDAMMEAIHVAKQAGADAIKYQWVSSPERLAARRHAEDYLAAYRTIAFHDGWLRELKVKCDEVGIEFMCTVYLPEDIPVIAPLVKRFKVASFEATDEEFLHAHDQWIREDEWIVDGVGKTAITHEDGYLPECKWRVPKAEYEEQKHGRIIGAFTIRRELIVSTGMGDEQGVDLLIHGSETTAILHCVSAYPCPPEEANLAGIKAIRQLVEQAEEEQEDRIRRTNSFAGVTSYEITIGYSDHTRSVLTGALAVATGAEIIEVHFRLDSTDPANPDYGHSLSPDQLRQYVQNVRFAELAMGSGIKKMQPSEERWAKYRVRV